uniref:Uncharacterized protein n=1 Tax=Nicotiana tabacum TaxID=4097 RepID=A0A1S3ZND5_TOBAC|nr:PREDICTED: uncharacterized protein LOC107788705 [Nicotiana tabacum]
MASLRGPSSLMSFSTLSLTGSLISGPFEEDDIEIDEPVHHLSAVMISEKKRRPIETGYWKVVLVMPSHDKELVKKSLLNIETRGMLPLLQRRQKISFLSVRRNSRGSVKTLRSYKAGLKTLRISQ